MTKPPSVNNTIEISHRTIIFAVSLLIGLWFLNEIRGIILQLFVALIITTALNPLVDKLNKIHLPRTLGILIVYALIILVISLAFASIIPPLADQTASLARGFPSILSDLGITALAGRSIVDQISALGSIPGNIVKVSLSIINNVFAVITVIVISFYMLLYRNHLDDYLHTMFGKVNEGEAKLFIDALEVRLGGWVRGQLILMSIIGILCYIGLTLLGIPYALPLAILAGILEIVPTIGPIISAIPALAVGLSISPITGLAIVALYFLIQTAENHLLVPKIMERSVGINPLIIIVLLAIGLKLGGIMGAFLSVPVFLAIQVVSLQFLAKRNKTSA